MMERLDSSRHLHSANRGHRPAAAIPCADCASIMLHVHIYCVMDKDVPVLYTRIYCLAVMSARALEQLFLYIRK